MNRDRLVDNTGLLEQAWGLDKPGIVNRNRLVDKNRLLDKARTTKHARIVMRLADLDVLVRLIKVWGSESTG